MDDVLNRDQVAPERLIEVLRGASIECDLDGTDIMVHSNNCAPCCVRILPKPVLVEIFMELPTSAPAASAKDMANRWNSMSQVQWVYVEGSASPMPFFLARVCTSFRNGILMPHLISYCHDFPWMVYGLVNAVGGDVVDLEKAAKDGVH
jgi:hypothetical protein